MCEGVVPVLLLSLLSQMPVTTTQTRAYVKGCQRVFDKQYQAHRTELDAMAAHPGPQDTYYTFQYALMGMLSMYEATGDVQYLERVLTWAETMISKAVVIDRSGKRNWPGPWKSPNADQPIYYDLWELQGATELGRLARIILTNPKLQSAYGKRASTVYEFVERDVIDKRLDNRETLAGHLNQVNQRGHQMIDRTAMLLRLLADACLIGRKPKYLQPTRELALGFKKRFQPYRGALIWDLDVGEPNHPPDTAHANRFPLAVIDLYRAGIVFTREDVQGLADLFTKVIWNQSLSDPMFANFIDGSNGPFRGRGPWNNGAIGDGWCALGQFDSQVRRVCDATLRAILAGRRNPSLDYNSSMWGILLLSGELAKGVALAEAENSGDG